MFRISELVWTDNEVESIGKHGVTPDDVDEAIFGVDGEDARYIVRRDSDYYAILGETGSGRLLSMVGEKLADNKVRIFHAMDMNDTETATFRKDK
jgi:uncharacterized DUF497 family protein